MPSPFPAAYHHLTDDKLVNALAGGDRAAFAEIYERYWRELYRVAYQKIRSRETAEELVQDLFVSLWDRREQATIRDLRPYLFTALRFAVIDHIESKLVHERFMTYCESFPTQSDVSTTDHLALQDLTDAIEKNLQTLPEKTQQVFRLSRFECLTIPEIAERLDLSDKAIEYHLSKALKVVRTNLRHLGMVAILLWL